MFGRFEKINFRALPAYIRRVYDGLNVFIFTDNGDSGFKLRVTELFSGVSAGFAAIYAEIERIWKGIEGAREAFVFDNKAQIDAWVADPSTRPDIPAPEDMPIGALLLTRNEEESNYWWDGTTVQLSKDNEIIMDDYVSKSLDVTNDMENPSPANIDKIPTQFAVFTWAANVIKNFVWNAASRAFELWGADDITGHSPDERIAKFGQTEIFVGKLRAFYATSAARIIHFAGIVRKGIEVGVNGWRLWSYDNSKALIELISSGRLVIRRPNNADFEIENSYGARVFSVKDTGNVSICDNTQHEYLEAGIDGKVKLNPRVAATISDTDSIYAKGSSNQIGFYPLSYLAKKTELDAVREIAIGATEILVFQDTEQIDAWIAGTYIRPDGITIADVKEGTQLLTREASEPNYWWDGETKQPAKTGGGATGALMISDLATTTGNSEVTSMTQKASTGSFIPKSDYLGSNGDSFQILTKIASVPDPEYPNIQRLRIAEASYGTGAKITKYTYLPLDIEIGAQKNETYDTSSMSYISGDNLQEVFDSIDSEFSRIGEDIGELQDRISDNTRLVYPVDDWFTADRDVPRITYEYHEHPYDPSKNHIVIRAKDDSNTTDPLVITAEFGYGCYNGTGTDADNDLIPGTSVTKNSDGTFTKTDWVIEVTQESATVKTQILVPAECKEFSIFYFVGTAPDAPKVGSFRIASTGEVKPMYSATTPIENFSTNGSTVVLEGVTRIGSQAFSECSNLVSITIPKTVTSIGQSIAYNCCCLKKIVNYRETPQPVGGYIFPWVENESGCIVYVPAGSVEAYRAADGWKDFSNITMIE